MLSDLTWRTADRGSWTAHLSPCYTSLRTAQIIPGPYAIGLGEPLNVIISGKSDKSVLNVPGFLLWVT